MSADPGFRLHPKAAQDTPGIWEYIAEDTPSAAGRVRDPAETGFSSIHATIRWTGKIQHPEVLSIVIPISSQPAQCGISLSARLRRTFSSCVITSRWSGLTQALFLHRRSSSEPSGTGP